jgi:N-acyl-D-amino-acid deacylase
MGHWARDLGVMPMQEAVRQLTSVPADVFGFAKRGRIQLGHAADLLLFDPKTVARGPKKRVNDLPGGAPRLTTDAIGVHGVWVNGQQVADAGGLVQNPALAGMLITEFADC